ncbi:PREDICTED: protein DJ-1-like [Ceratosolen solmsi marchali]|uniref:Protein DJ-1-like n=1 Tax=Ceratosolen solmsi marchali TaxID=326594 RepID=A0AAJ6YSN5_9HYME|nr:PREDICTED: protein DJ-1-like [Ceratosolen solmsi marchali]
MALKTALCLLAEDAEEMEAVVTVDILRRAKVAVTIASITDKECVKCSRDIKICTDTNIEDIKDQKFDAVILPGGAGWKNLAASSRVGDILKIHESENRIIAAICAAPNVLRIHGIAKGKQITSHPSVKYNLKDYYNYNDSEVVVIDDNIITSMGPAFSSEFGLAIVEKLIGKDAAYTAATDLLLKNYK